MKNNFILHNENSIFYECGYSCDNAVFIHTTSGNFFLTDARYTLEAQNTAKNCEIINITSSLFESTRDFIKKLNIKNIYFDPREITYYDFNTLSSGLNIEFKSKIYMSMQKRKIKKQKEIQKLKMASNLGKIAFDKLANFINYKNTNLSTNKTKIFNDDLLKERDIFFNATNIFKANGELELSFNPIVAINENAAKAHALPTDKKLKNGDLFLLDAGVRFKKYCSDRTRTACFNESINFSKEQKFINQKQQEIYEIVKQAQELAIKKAKSGNLASDVDMAARDFIKKCGYGEFFIHSTGHGIGIDIHELPIISSNNHEILKPGMVFSIEPGIYIPNEFGIRIEDVVVITQDGCEIL